MAEIYFASPGDPNTVTGGYIYNKRVRERLRARGWIIHELRLPDAFPFPSAEDLTEAANVLSQPDGDATIVIDGLALGAFNETVLNAVRGRIVALVHHPLAEETGLTPEQVSLLFDSERQALRAVAGIVVSSPHTRQSLMDRYDVPEEKICAAAPGVDRPDTSVRAQSDDGPFKIVSVGTLTPRKGHDVLLAALGEIRELTWTATIAGGADRDPAIATQLFAQCRELGLEDRVTFAGERTAEALAETYQSASVFALATRYEGYGMVFSEAMVHGLPIVSCRAGAVPETVPKDAGLLVPPDDMQSFADALRRMLTDADFRKTCAAASREAGKALPMWEDTASLIAEKLCEVGAL